MYETDDPVEQLVHLYQDGAFNRRELIQRLVKHTGSLAAATAVVGAMALPAAAEDASCPEDVRVPANAPDLETAMVQFRGEASTLFAYAAAPRKRDAPLPGVLVIHENRGLNDHIMDVTRRVARAGFVALGIDLLSRQGGTPQFPDPVEAVAAYGRTTADGRLQDMLTAVTAIQNIPFVRRDRIGAVGFCAGGANCYSLAVNSPDLTAAVPFYGAAPNPIDLFDSMNAAIMPIYAELDRNLTTSGASVLTALVAKRKTFGLHVYEGVGHAFHNDTGAAYNRAAACDAWAKTIAFFNLHLRKP